MVEDRPEIVVEGAPRARLTNAVREAWVFRATVRAFAERDIRVKYKQTALGIVWALIQPLAFMAVFTFTIGRVTNVAHGSVPYAAFTLSALVPWTFLSTSVAFGSNAVLAEAAMVRRVYFPREVPVLAAVVGTSVDFAIGLALFFVIGPFLGATVSAWWLLSPFLFVLVAALAVAVATPLAAMNVYYRDFRFAIPFAIQLWLFASPVAYPLSIVPRAWRPAYVLLNPAAGIIDSFSSVLARGTSPTWSYLGASVLGTVVLALVGYRIFKRLEPEFADVI